MSCGPDVEELALDDDALGGGILGIEAQIDVGRVGLDAAHPPCRVEQRAAALSAQPRSRCLDEQRRRRRILTEAPVEPCHDSIERETWHRKRTRVEVERPAPLVVGRGDLVEREPETAY